MGHKLGKMVKIFFSFLLILSFDVLSKNTSLSKHIEFSGDEFSLDKEANIYTISAGINGITLKNVKIDKPSSNSLKMFKLITPRDKFGLKLLDKDGSDIFLMGIGNPFYAHAQHIGYEDSNVFGGYITTDMDIAIPINVDISHIVLGIPR
jgi:hypothetical protein